MSLAIATQSFGEFLGVAVLAKSAVTATVRFTAPITSEHAVFFAHLFALKRSSADLTPLSNLIMTRQVSLDASDRNEGETLSIKLPLLNCKLARFWQSAIEGVVNSFCSAYSATNNE